jgi:hypothetical protein
MKENIIYTIENVSKTDIFSHCHILYKNMIIIELIFYCL